MRSVNIIDYYKHKCYTDYINKGTTLEDLYNTGVRVIIDNYLIEESKKVRDYGNYWSASSAGYCMRKNIFDRLKVEPTNPDDARKQRVFTAGHLFHEWLQSLTKDAGCSVSQEGELQDEKLMVIGHYDDIIKVDDHLILYDYKTANSRSFGYKKEMSYFHRMQLGTYLYMLRQSKEYKNLTESRILTLEKDTLRTKEFVLFYDEELEREILEYWNTINSFWTDKKLPPCTCEEQEGGFMSKPAYNPYFYNGQPCSRDWYLLWKENNKEKVNGK